MSRWSHLADDDDGQAGKEGVEEPKPRLLRRSSVPARPRRLEEHLRKQNTREGTLQRKRDQPGLLQSRCSGSFRLQTHSVRLLSAHLGAAVQAGGAGAVPGSAISDLTTGTQDPERKTVRVPRGEERSRGRGGGGKC